MIRRVAAYGLSALLGLALGIASALYMAGLWPGMKPLEFGDIEVGGWRSDFAIGSDAANPYTRARVARHGLLALAKSEAVYFTKTTDASGQPLTEDCTYRLLVDQMPARWWSITLYNSESLLPINEDEALSVNADQVSEARGQGEYLMPLVPIIVARDRPEDGLWISSRNASQFDLTLRLYMPDDYLLEKPEDALSAPSLTRVSCDGDAA